MKLKPNEDIGVEVHPASDQFLRLEEGSGLAIIDGNEYNIKENFAIIVPAGAKHNIINTGHKDMKLYTIYSPSHHRDQVAHRAKEDALTDNEKFDNKTTE